MIAVSAFSVSGITSSNTPSGVVNTGSPVRLKISFNVIVPYKFVQFVKFVVYLIPSINSLSALVASLSPLSSGFAAAFAAVPPSAFAYDRHSISC